MRHEHKELIREEMHSNNKYCHDICSLSISDIYVLLQFNKNELRKYRSGINVNDNIILLELERINRNIAELEEYLTEYSMRLSNRTRSI